MKVTCFIYLCFTFVLISCNTKKKEQEITVNDPQLIVDKAMVAAGSEKLDGKEICFDFRGKEYISMRKNWRFQLERIMIDSVKTIHDILSNDGFNRFVDDKKIELPDSLVSNYGNSVNSVHYFASLPYGLNDKAVNKEFYAETIIKNKPYYIIKVTFNEANGGDDFEDIFLYWIHKETYTVDYLAYEFHTNGGGLRFREAINEKTIDGIRFVDYKNYKPESSNISLYDLEEAYKKGKLKLLSKIELENIYVQPCNQC